MTSCAPFGLHAGGQESAVLGIHYFHVVDGGVGVTIKNCGYRKNND